MGNERLVYPVIHQLTPELTVEQAVIAKGCGADGVFLISHEGADFELGGPLKRIRAEFPGWFAGANFLSMGALDAAEEGLALGCSGVWSDEPVAFAGRLSAAGAECSQMFKGRSEIFFASVAFKYQQADPDPGKAAAAAARAGFVPVTSGLATGQAPELRKIEAMRAALEDDAQCAGSRLGIASGLDAQNVGAFAEFADVFLVSTKVCSDFYRLDPALLEAFVRAAKG